MKKIFTLTFSLLLTFSFALGQIEITKIKKAEFPPTNLKYDSLDNYIGMNVYAYIGQEFYLRPQSQELRKHGYMDFYNSTDDGVKANGENIYKYSNNFASSYEALQGKYFKVVDVIKHPKASEAPYFYEKVFFIKLVEKEHSDTCYYKYDGGSIEDVFPFTVVGYYLKCKKRYIGKKFVTQGKPWTNENQQEKDIETAKEVTITKGKIWTVIDVTIVDDYYDLSLILKSKQGEKVAIPLVMALKYYFVVPMN